ncbi:hypothetical protein NDU88_004027 [Pleurodeles waltl]|uniref:Uncharacterized protein n=1 Tax=Pleurodeles waltl TaxID=8319 RepID=A0AAV7M805_PLEWA|nr:hypothetical protein NDU88_004027 [Pleurodeles waltl]
MTAVSASGRMGAQAFMEHARVDSVIRQAQPQMEKGGELAGGSGKEKTLGGASKMAAFSDAHRLSRGSLEKRQLGATSKMAALIHNIKEEVVVISDDEEEVQVSQKRVGGRGTVGSGGISRQRVGCVGGPDRACAVWIVGHSFVRWAEKQASSRHFGRQLGLDGPRIKLRWVGKSGMRWGELLYVLAKRMEQGVCPNLLVIHLGENDLVALSGIGLLKAMKLDLGRIKERWAGTHIVWTSLVPRRAWSGANSFGGIEKQRKKINREMMSFCKLQGFFSPDS